ncbi:MAG: carbohydrate porin [Pseudomonadota bacterium]
MRQTILKALPAAMIMAFSMASAHASDAEGEFHGYFRAGAGQNSSNGSQACFGLEGVPKYRLGNECDLYGEFGYTKELARSANGVSFVGTVMATIYSPTSDVGNNSWGLGQMMVEAKNVEFLNGGVAWIGKRYYDRPDIHMQDFKYLHGDGVGGGIQNINAGPGKFSYGIFRNDVDQRVSATRHSFIYDGLAVNPGGSLKIDSTLIRGDHQSGSDAQIVQNGWSISLVHTQAKVLGGENTLALQYGSGSGIKFGGTDTSAPSDIKRTRVFDHMFWQVTPDFSGSVVALVQRDKTDAGTTTWTSFGVRPVYALHENFKLQLEVGHDTIKPASGGENQQLTKVTFAPTLTMGRGFWARPELRAFVTYAKWNDAAQAAATPGSTLSSTGVFGGSTNGTSIGVQVETWF